MKHVPWLNEDIEKPSYNLFAAEPATTSGAIDRHFKPLSIKRSFRQHFVEILFATGIVVAIVAVAHLSGIKLTLRHIGSVVGLSTYAGIAFLVAGAVLHAKRCRHEKLLLTIVCGLPVYSAIIVVLVDPNLWVWDTVGAVRSISHLGPVFLGAVAFFPRRLWISAVGAWLVIFAWLVGLSYNLSHVHSGVGFWTVWAD